MAEMHSHNNGPQNFNKAFTWGITLNLIYVIVEFVFGLIINSMALIADAGHNLSDVLGLLLAWGASYLAQTKPTATRTYGLRKSTVLAAMLNAIILFIAVGAISVEAVRKIITPEQVAGNVVMIVAGIGFIINSFTALLFVKGREHDINIKGAFIHMVADAGVSLGVVAAGLVITFTGIYLLDPIISLVIVVVIVIGTWGLLKESFHLSMDAVPKNINLNEVLEYLKSVDSVEGVHDLHIWGMSTTENALTVHLIVPDPHKRKPVLSKVCSELHTKFGIDHTTIQIEENRNDLNCKQDTV